MSYFPESNVIYVGGLPDNITYENLNDVFCKCGRIDRIWIGRRLPIYAFVEFVNTKDAEYAVKTLDGTRIFGFRTRVEISHSRRRRDINGWRPSFRNNNRQYRDRSRSSDTRRHFRSNLKNRLNFRRIGNISTHVERSSFRNIGGGERGVDDFNDDDWEEPYENEIQHRHSSNPKIINSQPSEQIIKNFKCLVCFDQFPLNQIVFCSYDKQAHAFCTDCVFGSALAAVGDVPMAKGGIGLRCMMPECDNPILYSEIRVILSKDLQIKLEERILQESIGLASIANLERCKKCNFAIEMEVNKNINKVFDCLNCGIKTCRICERDWDNKHFGISCKELDKKEKDMKDKQEREIEKQLNEAIVRKCPRCGIQFIKEEGCNKMVCRCGMTQCYLCRESDIIYDHFCQHFRDPTKEGCDQCNKKCLLHENSDKKDEQLLKQILKNEKIRIQFKF
ncbi:RRM domain-containing protein [Meloidogyne graminicola]|uniref:RRM domain-containing protein n=1 Tax=Meloidogyne graminicola TaxID=189291 RepID=A0A8S9ZM86_9BILA|nr:RRM domain-containing protein [Meloidogyne graminicola]